MSRLHVNRTRLALGAALVLAAATTTLTLDTTNGSFTGTIANTTDTAGTGTWFTCRNAEARTPGVYLAWAMQNPPALTEPDFTGNGHTGTYTNSLAASASIGCTRDTPPQSASFDGNTCLYPPTNTQQNTPNLFTLEVWFRTSSGNNGKLIGLSEQNPGTNHGKADRHIYFDPSGRLIFGVYTTNYIIISTPPGTNYADNTWHAAAASLSPAGMRLYVDGQLAATNPAVTAGLAYTGYWNTGCGSLSLWPISNGTKPALPVYFTGQLQYAAVYTRALTDKEILEHYQAGAP